MSSKKTVKFDVSDCTLREESEEHSTWSNANGVYIVLRVPKTAPNWSFDLHDIDAATNYFSEQSARNGGVLVQMDVVTVGGQTALRGLFKYRSPLPQSMGMMFVSILWIRLPDTTVQINVESIEQGITGAREAAVFAMTGDGQAEAAPTEPVLVDSIEELFADMRAKQLRVLPSDDSRYDDIIPDHPLSRVRQRMAQVEATLTIATEHGDRVAPAKAPWWKVW
jgi:hypothetical protein